MNPGWSYILTAIGVFGLWLAGRKDWRGWRVGLSAQVLWLAYVLLAVGSPIAWLAWSGPVVMYVFLRWISGIPFTEAQALRTRGEDYARYQRSTPMLFPWFPKPEK